MKYLIFLTFLSTILMACEPPQNQPKAKANPLDTYTKYDLFVKRFLESHPKMKQNDILKEEANTDFKKAVLKYFKDSSGLSYIAFKIKSINKLGNGYVVHLENSDNYKTNDISERSHIDVFALVNGTLAKSLNQSSRYSLKQYKKVNFLKEEQLRFVTGDYVWNNKIDLGISDVGGRSYGNYILEVQQFSSI